jgi:hypothetical protein
VLICQIFFVNILPFHESNTQNGSYWDLRLQARMIEAANARIFNLIELGYIVSLAVLLADAIVAAYTKNKSEFRSALIFAALAAISILLFYPVSLIVPTR